MRVLKFELSGPVTNIALANTSRVLDVAMQGSKMYLWALVFIENPSNIRKFIAIPTGETLDIDVVLAHIKTVHTTMGLVWHIFEVIE